MSFTVSPITLPRSLSILAAAIVRNKKAPALSAHARKFKCRGSPIDPCRGTVAVPVHPPPIRRQRSSSPGQKPVVVSNATSNEQLPGFWSWATGRRQGRAYILSIAPLLMNRKPPSAVRCPLLSACCLLPSQIPSLRAAERPAPFSHGFTAGSWSHGPLKFASARGIHPFWFCFKLPTFKSSSSHWSEAAITCA